MTLKRNDKFMGPINLIAIPNLGGFLTIDLVTWGANNNITNVLFHCDATWSTKLHTLEISILQNTWDPTLGQKLGLIGIEFPIPTIHLASKRIDPNAFSHKQT